MEKSKQILAGQHAVVTGGGRGIGAAIARELAEMGANLTLMGRDKQRLEAQCSELQSVCKQKPLAVVVDVTHNESVSQAFATCRKQLGDVAILVNNAGAVESVPFKSANVEHWQRMLSVNLVGAMSATQQVLPTMTAAKKGRIVNIASTAGMIGYPYATAYCAAKHALVGFTRALALEIAKSGVTVNAVCPGYTETDLLRNAIDTVSKKTGRSTKDVQATFMQSNPQGRFITPQEVASAVGWLCRPEQLGITGQTLVIDGGETL